jgi:hypothetical protein
MAINENNIDKARTQTGVVLVVFRDPDVPADTKTVIERTTISASVANPAGWAEIGTLDNTDTSGTYFIDYLPLTKDVYFYRAKHTAPGFVSSSYIFEVSGSATTIPQIDWRGKPWLLNQTPLQLVMVISASNATQWVVYPEVNQPVIGSGTPTISLIASGNVGPISNVGTKYFIDRPAGSASGSESYVIFESTLSGYRNGVDKVELTPIITGSAANPSLRTVITPIATDSSSMIITVQVFDETPDVGPYINLSYTALNIPDIIPSTDFILSASEAKQYTIIRPDFNLGFGRINFTATASARISSTDNLDVPEKQIDTNDPALATITLGNATSGSNNITIPFSFTNISTTQYVEVFIQENSGSAPSVTSVEFTGTPFYKSPINRNDGRTSLRIPITRPSNYILTTFVPYDTLNRRGVEQTRLYQATAVSSVPPANFASQSNQTIGDTSVTNRVMMPSSNLPLFIRTYLNNSVYGDDVAVSVGANATQSISHTGLIPQTTYSWRYSGISGSGESNRTDIISTTTTAGGTLATPTASFTGWQARGGGNVNFSINNTTAYPAGTTFAGEIYSGSAPGNLLGSLNLITEFTLQYPIAGPGTNSGYAVIRATQSGYTTSADSANISWNNQELKQPF